MDEQSTELTTTGEDLAGRKDWRSTQWLRTIDREQWNIFFDYMRQLLADLGLSTDGESISLNRRNDNRHRVGLTLRSRVVLSLSVDGGLNVQMMLPVNISAIFPDVPLFPGHKDKEWSGTPDALWRGMKWADFLLWKDRIYPHNLAISKEYLGAGGMSNYRKHHIPDLFRMAMEPVFREKALDYIQKGTGPWPGTSESEDPNNTVPMRRYWAAGFNIGNGQEDLKRFVEGNYWQALMYEDSNQKKEAREARECFAQIQPGDQFLIRGLGGRHDLKVHYVGRVLRKDVGEKRLDLEPLDVPLYNGKAPTGKDAGNWHNTLQEVTRPEDIKLLFGGGTQPLQANGEVPERVLPALNMILYGPPGTGKTHALKNEYQARFTTKISALTREQRLTMLVEQLTWWEVIAMVLLDLGPSSTSAIRDHELLRIKAGMSVTKNVRAVLWANLQMHTVTSCELVKYDVRSEPLIFNKREGSIWEVLSEAVDQAVPELREQLAASKRTDAGGERVVERFRFITFHQAYSYEDFIEGLKPQMNDGQLGYEMVPGVFKELCALAENDPEHEYALFIDEINRGNVAAIFGELITLIEEDKRAGGKNPLSATLPYSKTERPFSVPSNLYVIGTMNTADRSVEALDTALRRRFSFIEYPSKPDALKDLPPVTNAEGTEVDLQKLLWVINARIEMLLDRDHHIGHSYFMNWGHADPEEKLRSVFKNNVIPLLREYFYGDPMKVGMVLGSPFVEQLPEKQIEFAKDFRMDDLEPKTRYAFHDPMDRVQIPLRAFADIADGK